MFGISPVQLVIVLVMVLLLFGTKKLKNLGGDLGSAINGFKKAVSDDKSHLDNNVSEETDDVIPISQSKESNS
ncbi:MAG: sec-independent protein translocase protein TatA [Paraglaciecola sp.]|jgi:sec-independent protein translocase protein TatA